MSNQDKDHSGAAVRGESVAEAATDQLYGAVMNIPCTKTLSHFVVQSEFQAYKIGHRDARHAAADLIAAFSSSARAADAPSEPSELCGIPTLRDLAELFHASAMSNTAVLIHPESARSLFDAMTTPPKDESAPLSYVCRVELHQDRIILDDKYESIDTVRTALAKSRAADALDSQPIEPYKLESNEQYNVQMAAIGAAAFGYCKLDGIQPEYMTQPLRDVVALYEKYAALLASSQPTDGGVRNG